MLDIVKQICVALSTTCFFYSMVLNITRHTTKDDKTILDTCQDLALNSSILAISWLLREHCLDEDLCVAYGLGLSVIALAMIVRNYNRTVRGIKYTPADLGGKVYIVTGSSAGIGLETARELAKMGGTVILACRSKDKALKARGDILRSAGSSETKVIFLQLDLCSLASVRTFFEEFTALGLPLHGLINNAGVMMPERRTTEDGIEMVFQSNHLGHFLLTNLLLPALEKTSGRIVNVASSMHRLASSGFNFDDIMSVKQYSLFGTYGQSKLANILFTTELDRRLREKGSNVVTNSVHPGIVLTEVTRSLPAIVRYAHALLVPVMLLVQKMPSQGAYCSVFAAASPEMARVSGYYLMHCRPHPCTAHARDLVAAQRLWRVSADMVGLNDK